MRDRVIVLCLAVLVLLGGVANGQEADKPAKASELELRVAMAEKRAEAAEKRLSEVEKQSKPTPEQVKKAGRESFAAMWRGAREQAIAGCGDAKGHGSATLVDGKLTYTCQW